MILAKIEILQNFEKKKLQNFDQLPDFSKRDFLKNFTKIEIFQNFDQNGDFPKFIP